MKVQFTIVLALLFAAPLLCAQGTPVGNEELLQKVIKRERFVTEDLQGYHPIVETYIQNLKRSDGRLVPSHDHYFLSVAEFSGQLRALRFKPRGTGFGQSTEQAADAVAPNSIKFDPSGFVAMAFPDPSTFDLDHYRFQFLNMESLGEVHCLVFDVQPRAGRNFGLFEGRIWVEDQHFTIVRFNGIYKGSTFYNKYFHFDSWRVNTGSGLWVPAVIYSEELALPCCGAWKLNWTKVRFKAQTRFWGYNLGYSGSEAELSRIVLDPSSGVADQSASAAERNPLEQLLAWERQAEDNVADQLEHIGLLAPRGEVEKSMDTVVRNLQVANHLDAAPEVRCRVLLTSNFESVIVGHTIILSRGLLDVLPNEATLAALLANGLAIASLQDRAYAENSFLDMVRFGARDTMRSLHFTHSPQQQSEAFSLAQSWLKSSPYRDSLGSVTRFTAELRLRSLPITHLLTPALGDSAFDILGAANVDKKLLAADNLSELRALPLGSRILVDPWNDQIHLRTAAPGEALDQQNLPFEITFLEPYLRAQPQASPRVLLSSNTGAR